MQTSIKIKTLIFFSGLIMSGMVFGFFDRAEAFWSGGGYFCSTSHICYDHRYPCTDPSWLNCPNGNTQINCDNHNVCRASYNGWSKYYSCGYDNVSCSETRYCTFATGVASWSACSPTGLQWATDYTLTTVYGTTTCADAVFAITRFCSVTE
jgi:hypothetical protein